MRRAPQPVDALPAAVCRDLVGIFCDVDDTLTTHGRLPSEAYEALWAAHRAGLRVVPITGRPGGWTDAIARLWPVDGVVGENGGLWFWHDGQRLQRRFLQDPPTRAGNRSRLDALAARILSEVPGAALASDQSYRDLDLAIDFCEDVPRLGEAEIDRIVSLFTDAGATSKVSSIHVNGWFGDFDKLTGCRRLVRDVFGEELRVQQWLYVGDSANDEPMFEAFPHSVGVANVREFLPRMQHWPVYITPAEGGQGFSQLVGQILSARGASPSTG